MSALDRKEDARARERIARREARAVSLGIELHAAAKSGETGRIGLLIAFGASVEARMPGGWTPLHTAARHGRSASVEALLDAGADPNARAEDAMTPLHMAAIPGDAASIEALVKAGADTDARDAEGLVPFDILPGSVPDRVRDLCRPGASPVDDAAARRTPPPHGALGADGGTETVMSGVAREPPVENDPHAATKGETR